MNACLTFLTISRAPAAGNGLLRWVILAGLAAAIPAKGQGISVYSPTTTRQAPSADWYADRPEARRKVAESCAQYPEAAKTNADCAAAWQGQIIAAEREARSRSGLFDQTPPTRSRYWALRPEERAETLEYCARMTPQQQAGFFCGPAQAAQAEAEGIRQPRPQPRNRARGT